ncbi:MAG: tetratricopeptide repeat protein [Desulfuromonadales bacterium]|nr:tetratricopeptide repeat protein [Desulfuromonadales bacterium]
MTEHNQQSALLGKIVAYTELMVNDPRSTIFVSLAETYRKIGLFKDAREIIAKGIDYHPDFGPAYVVLARIECQLENFAASCSAFERALALDPDSLAALVGYARVNLLLQRENEARDLLLHARSLSPADPVINKMLLGLSPQPEVEKVPAPVVERMPLPVNNLASLASITLADLYLAQGLTEKALSLYRQLLTRNPDNLELRRKIREAEERIDEESSSLAQESASSSPITTDNRVDLKEHETTESCAEQTMEQPEPLSVSMKYDAAINLDDADSTAVFNMQAEVEAHEITATALHEMPVAKSVVFQDSTEIINTLNNWLNNIRLRREHV